MQMNMRERDALPKTAFAIPEKRAYPIHDEKHAKMALSMVAAHGTPEEKNRVRSAVKKKFPGIKQDGSLSMEMKNQGKKPMMKGKGPMA